MGKDYAEEGCKAGREEVRSEDQCASSCDDPCREFSYHSSAVRVVDQIFPPMKCEWPDCDCFMAECYWDKQ